MDILAVVKNSTLKQKMGRGKVEDLEKIAGDKKLTHPSIIVIGSVVNIKT